MGIFLGGGDGLVHVSGDAVEYEDETSYINLLC